MSAVSIFGAILLLALAVGFFATLILRVLVYLEKWSVNQEDDE